MSTTELELIDTALPPDPPNPPTYTMLIVMMGVLLTVGVGVVALGAWVMGGGK